IRFWEREFSDFLIPIRTIGGQRRYDKGDVEIIQKINQLVNKEGFTLEGARKQLKSAMEVMDATDQVKRDDQLNELAITMSDYLLQKLFERIRREELSPEGKINGVEK
ncbi:MAG: MerR family transcriptional regulator, partial [bacterium]